MRSIPAAVLGLSAVSFLSFFIVGQQHPFGSEAASTNRSVAVTETTTISRSVGSIDCASGDVTIPLPRSCAAVTQQPSEEDLRASINSFADALRRGALATVASTLEVLAASVAKTPGDALALDEPVTSFEAPLVDETADALTDASPIEDAVVQAVGQVLPEGTPVLPGSLGLPPVQPGAPPLEVVPSTDSVAETLRQGVQQQANATIETALARTAQAPSEAAQKPTRSVQPQTTPPTASSTLGLQADPGCTVEQDKGDTWSRSAVQCFRQETRTSGSSTSSVTTASSSVSVASTTSDAVVP